MPGSPDHSTQWQSLGVSQHGLVSGLGGGGFLSTRQPGRCSSCPPGRWPDCPHPISSCMAYTHLGVSGPFCSYKRRESSDDIYQGSL